MEMLKTSVKAIIKVALILIKNRQLPKEVKANNNNNNKIMQHQEKKTAVKEERSQKDLNKDNNSYNLSNSQFHNSLNSNSQCKNYAVL